MPFRRSVPLLKFTLLLPLLLAFGACSLFHHGERQTLNNMSVEQLYQRAHKLSQDGNWGSAETVYQKLIARFPYGAYNEQSQIELAYAQYKDGKSEDAYSTINEFIKTYPTQKHIAYAYYLRGLINFDRTETGLQHFAGISPSRFDQGYALQSFDDFNTLVTRFPDTRYAADARQRMIYLRNQLAQSELNVAEFYLQRKAYVAAADRAKYIVAHYQRSPQVADALAVLAKSYHLLGQQKLADQATQVLKLNYPDHPYLRNPKKWPSHHTWVYRLIPLTSAH
ncbi:MAG: outer membrane protein assembly factor BamD [Rhodanobacteraceae bacterium]|nr:MAG: outer membrane protein assembly factor BamD [Rhodanobacteraceae bacterium]